MKCKKGDLAVIISVDSPEFVPNIGGLVEVLEFAVGYDEPHWRVCALQSLLGGDPLDYIVPVPAGGCGVIADRLLEPLRGDTRKREEKKDEVLCN